MGRVELPLLGDGVSAQEELPRCSWCGSISRSVCGYCKVRAYCSLECQQNDWKSGHQTACVRVAPAALPAEDKDFQLYEVPYVVRWAINLEQWRMSADSKEYAFLLSRIPDNDARKRIASSKSWSAAKLSLAKELAVRRMAEVLTQAIWTKVQWRHDSTTDRDFLLQKEEYVWTGQKYQNSNRRFPNFNFSMIETDSYLFLVSHPLAITGIYASGPLTAAMPDPREAFAEELAAATHAAQGEASPRQVQSPTPVVAAEEEEEDSRMLGNAELIDVCEPVSDQQRRERLRHAHGSVTAQEAPHEAEAFWVDNSELQSGTRGIAYRRSMSLADKEPTKIAEFNTVVRGIPHETWLQVEDFFLPMKVGGKEAPVPEVPKAEARNTPESPPTASRPLVAGTGSWYEVVCERPIIRTAPDLEAPMQGTRRRGQKLEVFDWDPTRKWRRISTSLGPAWVLLDAETGPVLRPKDVPFSQQPLHPLCQAAREGCLPDIQRFLSEGLEVNARDVDGQTPLMLAAQGFGWEGFVACVLLLEAKADPNLTLNRADEMSLREKIVRLEREKRAAAEHEDFVKAASIKNELDALKRNLDEPGSTALTLAGETAAAELLKMMSTGSLSCDMQKLHAIYDEIRDVPGPECKGIPGRVEALVRVAESKGASQEQQRAGECEVQAGEASVEADREGEVDRQETKEDPSRSRDRGPDRPERAEAEDGSDELPVLDTEVAEESRAVVYRVVHDKAWVYEEPSLSAELLGQLKKNQLVEVFDYDRSRSFGRVEVCHRSTRFREKGWVLFEDESLGDLLKALVGKFAYFRTLGKTSGRQWSQIVLGQEEVSDAVAGGAEPDDRPSRPRRHPLRLGCRPLPRWRCDVHCWKDNHIVVCRGPPDETIDPEGEFQRTQAARFLEIDSYDKALDHTEPQFIEVPIVELLPEKWHSDYVRACGGGERGDQTRINDLGPYRPHIPKV
ncbi:unnamed protein product [Symbiodinium sp. CCMP2592]|nr:unnamed protein product [Symbiodinium sp. CCMP2592]